MTEVSRFRRTLVRRWEPYDFWVMNPARDGAEELAQVRRLIPVAQFENKRGEALLIYAASRPTTESGGVR